MNSTMLPPLLSSFSVSLPAEGAVSIVLEAGIPIFRASQPVQDRIETLLDKQTEVDLSSAENSELDAYAAMDDYLSFVNRTLRNLYLRSESSHAPEQTAS